MYSTFGRSAPESRDSGQKGESASHRQHTTLRNVPQERAPRKM